VHVEPSPAHEIASLITTYKLVPLPVEGTLYASTYVSGTTDAHGAPTGTAIVGLYAHQPLSRSLFHRLTSDEVWHFYAGDALRLVLLHADGSSSDVVLGHNHKAGEQIQFVVPAGTWQAGELADQNGGYALFGCTMAPGFTGAAFEGGVRSKLLAQYPSRAEDIERLGLSDTDHRQLPQGFTQ
jgi:predicted cupin superfamily sugar epimerase